MPITPYFLSMRSHEYFLQRCLSLAMNGCGKVSPNPMVGAVLVYEERIIGEGYHTQYGEAHAEVNCILSVKESEKPLIDKSTLYVSLEPCSHQGKTPPCADFIIRHSIPNVVIGCKDLSAKVNGDGIKRLRNHGINVTEHILEAEAIELNKRFFTFHQKKRPYIILKWAQSAEGYIGSPHEPIRLSDTITDKLVHQWRAEEDAIWVGFNTAKIDNPRLNVRHVHGRNPIRILYDRTLDLDEQSHLFDQSQPTIIFNTIIDREAENRRLIKIYHDDSIGQILEYLYSQAILSVLVEGGEKLITQLIDQNHWDEIRMIQTTTSLKDGTKAPLLEKQLETMQQACGKDMIHLYKNSTLR